MAPSGARVGVLLATGVSLLIAIMTASCGGQGAPSDGTAALESRGEAPSDRAAREQRTPRARSIDEVLQQLPLANIAFNAPKTVRLDETRVIQVLLSDEQLVGELRGQLTELGVREGARIRASDEMEANLTGLGFRIQAVTPAQQPVGPGVTEWKWQVEPTAPGRRRLHLTLAALITVRDRFSPSPQRTKYAVRTFERTLTVESVPVAFRERLTDFIGGSWQWLATTLVIPLALWGVRRRRKVSDGPVSVHLAQPKPE